MPGIGIGIGIVPCCEWVAGETPDADGFVSCSIGIVIPPMGAGAFSVCAFGTCVAFGLDFWATFLATLFLAAGFAGGGMCMPGIC